MVGESIGREVRWAASEVGESIEREVRWAASEGRGGSLVGGGR
jgi:hypothetical protein